MSRFLITLFVTLSLVALLVNCQTYSNCKDLGSGYKVEWTADQTGNKLSSRYTVPNSAGWAAIGFKLSANSGMLGSTIVLTSKQSIGEYSASTNGQPSALIPSYYTVASSSVNGGTTTISLDRSLSRPGTAPATYYEIAKGMSMSLLIASHSSASYPTKHDKTFSVELDFFTTSNCSTVAQTSTKPAVSKTSNSTDRANGASSLSNGREVLMVVLMIIAMFVGLASL